MTRTRSSVGAATRDGEVTDGCQCCLGRPGAGGDRGDGRRRDPSHLHHALPAARVHRAGVVHHERDADAHDLGEHPLRRRHLPAGRQPHRTARRPVLRGGHGGPRGGARGGPDRRSPHHRRSRGVGHLLGPGCAQDPRGDRRDGGARRRPVGPARGASGARHDVRGPDDQRHRDRRRHRRRLLLHRDHPGRQRRRLPELLHRPGQHHRPLHLLHQGARLRVAGRDRRRLQGPRRRRRPQRRGPSRQRVGDHRVHAAVLPQRGDHGHLLPGRPPPGL